MVTDRCQARIRNNLFQYAFGRIVAEHLGDELEAAPVPGFPRTSEPVAGAPHTGPAQALTGHRVDLNAVIANCRPRQIILDGWFRRLEYFLHADTRVLWQSTFRGWAGFLGGGQTIAPVPRLGP